ncbi:MAG: threonylcarbamoyl-AMP synthase, partial [Clostridia bacterium]|nr:threonylcarbamoyl-AMP synthase [Clostridia bacterium]
AASAYDSAAVANIFVAKGRPQDNPLIVHIAELSTLEELCAEIPEKALEVARRFWPGPLTMVFKKKPIVPSCVTAGMETVAVRFTAHPIAQELIRRSGLPIAAPSANVSGYPSPTSAAHVMRDLSGKIDACIDGGSCACGVESTVLSMVNEPRLLRPGSVTLEQLREILPDIVVDKALRGEVKDDEKVSAPGMKYRHYAPSAPVVAVCGEPEKSAEFILREIGETELCICYSEFAARFEGRMKIPFGSYSDKEGLARGIFAALRDADKLAPSKIYVQCPDDSGVGLAVANRIKKAAGFNIVDVDLLLDSDAED